MRKQWFKENWIYISLCILFLFILMEKDSRIASLEAQRNEMIDYLTIFDNKIKKLYKEKEISDIEIKRHEEMLWN